MTNGMYRIGIVGATSLVGKELADELQESLLAASDVLLLDDEEEAAGQVAGVGEEASFVQPVEPASFERMDFAFFTGKPADTLNHWENARRVGASVVDLTYALEPETDVLVRAPWIADVLRGKGTTGEVGPDLKTRAVVAAHPAAVILGLIGARLVGVAKSMAVTLMEPASEHGREAMDELHQQTVNLLSFQSLPKEQYDAQVTFNLLPALGDASKVSLADVERRVAKHYATLSGGRLPGMALHVVQAPVFHGYVASVLVETAGPSTVAALEAALAGDHMDVLLDDSDPPSNLSAAGQEDVMVQVRATAENDRFWIWVAVDNLKLHALNGIACAQELRKLRPSGKVQ